MDILLKFMQLSLGPNVISKGAKAVKLGNLERYMYHDRLLPACRPAERVKPASLMRNPEVRLCTPL
jgi:hypothetical protein